MLTAARVVRSPSLRSTCQLDPIARHCAALSWGLKAFTTMKMHRHAEVGACCNLSPHMKPSSGSLFDSS